MRSTSLTTVLLTLTFFLTSTAGRAVEPRALDQNTLQALAEKAGHASLRDQCYLYAELVRGSTELANSEIAAGDSTASTATLHAVETYTVSLDAALLKDAKKLKDAEILLRESAFRLNAAMLASSIADRPAMASALTRINAVEAHVMGAVFAH